MKRCMLVATAWVVLISNAAGAGPASKQDANIKPQPSVAPLSDNNENANAYLYGYVMQVAGSTKGTGLTIVAIHPAGTRETEWQTVPICGKRATDLNSAIGHWAELVYSRDPNTARRGFCRELHSAKIVE